MEILPGVSAIAYAKFAMNVGFTHGLEELNVPVEQEVIIPAIHKPLDGTQLLFALLIGFLYVFYATVIDDRLSEDGQLISRFARLGGSVLRNAHQRADGINRGEEFGVYLSVAGGSATTHRKTGDSTMGFITDDAELAFDVWKEFGAEEGVVLPVGHIEVTVPVALFETTSSVRRYDNHFNGFAGGDKLVHDFVYISAP